MQFLNYFVENERRVGSLFGRSNPTIFYKKQARTHNRSSSFDKIRGLTGNAADPSQRGPASSSSSNEDLERGNESMGPSVSEKHVLATLGDAQSGLIHFLRVR